MTVTAKVWVALPAVFSAVIVSSASPGAAPATVTVASVTVAVAVSSADEATANTKFVPVKADATSTDSVLPTMTVALGNWPTASGSRSTTVTFSVEVALPALFRAVMVIVASPAPPAGVIISV